MTKPRVNSIIESLGVYLPPKAVSTDDVLRGCKTKIRFPLEHLTGIRSRRMAGEDEFAIDLAKKATIDCLNNSKYRPQDIDLLICCNISRYDGSDFRFSFEPNTSIKLQHYFGFDNALAFDITNACAGMFTAVLIIDAFIKAGRIQAGLAVSGEYISHLTLTAQKEITKYMDPRLACLTLGDAGAAIVLEKAPDDTVGFRDRSVHAWSLLVILRCPSDRSRTWRRHYDHGCAEALGSWDQTGGRPLSLCSGESRMVARECSTSYHAPND